MSKYRQRIRRKRFRIQCPQVAGAEVDNREQEGMVFTQDVRGLLMCLPDLRHVAQGV